MNKKTKALVLLSGGLDSILAVKLLLEQRIEVLAVNFRTNFCGPSKALRAAKMLGVLLREVDIREEFVKVLKKPKHGYGAGLNPCIDCHALMLKKAGEIMRAEEYDFVATGEVLGERPMSQHKKALKIIEKESGLFGYLLRPLSAKLLEPTIPEKDGRVNRKKLLDISGRNRQPQIKLAKKYDIKEYPTPAGGCALTQKDFADKLRELMKNKPDFSHDDLDLLKIGRHFWFLRHSLGEGGSENVQIILGRNQQENEILKNAKKETDILIRPVNFSGPEALIRDKGASDLVNKAKELIIQFAPKARWANKAQLNFEIAGK